jgi:hypothetical protein
VAVCVRFRTGVGRGGAGRVRPGPEGRRRARRNGPPARRRRAPPRLCAHREQEVRNLMWISECVAQDQKARIMDGIVFTV